MTNSFKTFGLAPFLLNNIAALGYKEPTPVQREAIAPILKGRDVLAAAQTGTGKTAAFALPLLTKLTEEKARRKEKSTRTLILAPTRELAAQIEENFREYAAGTQIKTALVFGGVNIRPQKEALAAGVDVLVATPGRLLDHISQGNLTLGNVRYLVLDEADRMLDMGFIRDIRKILALVPREHQTLLFSATFTDEIRGLADTILRDPVAIEIEKNRDSALVRQEVWFVEKKKKRELLRDLVVDNKWEQVLVFTRMKHAANHLAEQLAKDGFTTAAIHGNKSQSARTKALAGFKEKKIRILVATDIAARGLDIQGLPQVVNYELPNAPEDYVHRIGRTGRAGLTGLAVSLVGRDEVDNLKAIERLLKKKIEVKGSVRFDATETKPAKKSPSPKKPKVKASRVESKKDNRFKAPFEGSVKKSHPQEKDHRGGEKRFEARKTSFSKPTPVTKKSETETGKKKFFAKLSSKLKKHTLEKSTSVAKAQRAQKAEEKKAPRFETVRSNLPPGMNLARLRHARKFR